MSQSSPIHPDKINAIVGVECHFQTDRKFVKNYASSEQAETLSDISSICLNFASSVAEASGFGSLNRIVAFAGSSKFAMFALNPPGAQDPGPKLVGVKMSSNTDLKQLIKSINQLAQ